MSELYHEKYNKVAHAFQKRKKKFMKITSL